MDVPGGLTADRRSLQEADLEHSQAQRGVAAWGIVGALLFFVLLGMVVGGGSAIREDPTELSWTASLRTMEEALARDDVRQGVRAWRNAYGAAVTSRRWDALLDAARAYRRLVGRAGIAPHEEEWRFYVGALIAARREGSLEGVLRIAEAYAEDGNQPAAAQVLLLADHLAAQGRDPRARGRVRATRERLEGSKR